MTPLLGTNISSTPVGDVPAGDNKAARAKAAKVFTRHETRPLPGARRKPARIPRFSRNTNHESRLFFESRILPPPGPSHPPPSHSFPVHDGSPLFTIVRHCSSKNIALGQCHLSVRTGNTACLVFTKHETRDTNHGLCCGAAWGGYGAAWAATVPPPATRPFMFFTNHESRLFSAFPAHRPSDISPGANQAPNHGFHETRVTNHESRITDFFAAG